MTLPSEGINPWRSLPATGGTAPLPPSKTSNAPLDRYDRLDPAAPNGAGDTKEFQAFGEDGFTFWDLLDVVNPLQHIPIVSTLYRNMTEDQLDPAPRVMGSTLFLGPIGLASSLLNVVVEHNTGKDVGEHVMAYFNDEAGPLSGGKTAEAGPAAAGTDGAMAQGGDPVGDWAREQMAFYQGGAGPNRVDAWVQAQHAYYRSGDTHNNQGTGAAPTSTAGAPAVGTEPPTVDAWLRAQHAYYRQGDTPGTQQVAATSAAANHAPATLSVDDWVRQQHAHYHQDRTAPTTHQVAANAATNAAAVGQAPRPNIGVEAWAQAQTAFYRSETPAAARQLAAAGTDGTDPVTAWAREQTASYDADRPTEQPPHHAADAKIPARRRLSNDAVSAWAHEQMAWIIGDRAREVARTIDPQTGDRRNPSGGQDENASAAGGTGWFQDSMLAGWAKYQATRQLSEPAYRPDTALRNDLP